MDAALTYVGEDMKPKCEDCYYFAGGEDSLCKNPLANLGELIPCGWVRCVYLRSHENECGKDGHWWKPNWWKPNWWKPKW